MKILASIFPQNKFVGITLGYRHASLVVGGYYRGNAEILWQQGFTNDDDIFIDSDKLVKAISNMLQCLPKEFKNQYMPVQISLPDTLFNMRKLNFDDFPRRRIERDALVNWQLAKLTHQKPELIYTSWQLLNGNDKLKSVFACAINKEIVDAIELALVETGLKANIVNAASYYRNNILPCSVIRKSSILLAVEKDYWSLMIFDADEMFSYVHSTEREHGSQSDITNIIAESERLIWSYVNTLGNEKIENIYLMSTGDESELIEREINKRLQHQCKTLTVSNTMNVTTGSLGFVELSTVMSQ